jgi:lysophospholipase L1-like esterase
LLALVLIAPAAAAERPRHVQRTPAVHVGKVRLAAAVHGRAALLVPVRYPIEMVGRRLQLRVLLTRRGHVLGRWIVATRANAGRPRQPERRRAFGFVHRVDLNRGLTRRISHGPRPLVRVGASAKLDVDGDRVPELSGSDRRTAAMALAPAAGRLCSTLPMLRTRPGRQVEVRLPACTAATRWHITAPPDHGRASLVAGTLVYRPAAGFRGSDALRLSGGSWTQVKVGLAKGPVVRALGDSVTAGFGYYSNGVTMPFKRLLGCKPGETTYDDACSSNSLNTSNSARTVVYAPDYGLSNNVSWVAQWANEHGVTNFENLAVSGSEPSDWLPDGQLYSTLQGIESEDPDYVLMTLGANPLLSDMLFGVDNMGCAIESDITGGYRECLEGAFEEIHLRTNLRAVYQDLVANTDATIYLMQYHLAIPSTALAYSAAQIAMLGVLLNEQIASLAAEVSPQRLRPIAPPHFDVGIDISPVFPSEYSCSRLGYMVDGQSVQSELSQDELLLDHPLSFCSGPAEGPPWVISGDTGIHPSAAGYAQMAARVPPPG